MAFQRFDRAAPEGDPAVSPASAQDGWSIDPKTGLWAFNIRSVGKGNGFDLCCDFSNRAGTPTSLKPIGDLKLRGRLSILGGPNYSSSDIKATPHVIIRTESDVRRGVEDLVLVILVASGTSIAEQHNRTIIASPGDIIVIFMDVPFKLAQTEGAALKGSRLPASEFPHGLRDRSPLLLSPSFSSLATIAASHVGWHPSDRETFLSFSELIKEQLIALLSRGLEMADWRTDASPHLADAVKSMIEAEIANPMLSAKLLCARLGISRTSLFEALAAGGDTLGSLVRERRLIGCRDEMMHTNGTETLAAISERWGFRDQSTFTRAFSRRFGRPPTRWNRDIRESSGDARSKNKASSAALSRWDDVSSAHLDFGQSGGLV